MPEPIKTTIQEAFDHINTWIAEGSKDKAIQGLNEILNFDPTNAQAQKLLLEVKTGGMAAPSTTTPSAPSTVAPATPAIAPTPTVSAAPTPMPPPPMPAINTPPEQAPSPQPSIASTTATPSMTPPKATSIAPDISTETTPLPATETGGGMMSHMKLIIVIGGVIISLIAGYIFYKNVLADPGTAINELGEIQEQSAGEVAEEVQSIPTANEEVTEQAASTDDSSAASETATTEIKTTEIETTPPSGTGTSSVETSDTVEATSGKVKRRE